MRDIFVRKANALMPYVEKYFKKGNRKFIADYSSSDVLVINSIGDYNYQLYKKYF